MEFLVLPPSSSQCISTICISQSWSSLMSNRSKRKKNKSQNQPRRHHDRNPTTTSIISYPKPSPTPLLLTQTTSPRTRDQLLDQVLNDLQSSIERGITIDSSIFSSLLETCFQMKSLDHGIRLRRLIPPTLLRKSVSLSSKLLHLYASCGLVEEAHSVFDEMPNRTKTAFAWNSLISGYAELGLYEDAMALYFQMEEEGVDPDQFTFPRVLKACAGLRSIRIGEAVHRHVVRSGFANDPFVLNSLVDMYAKCGHIMRARTIFDNITNRDSISWNSMLTGYARHGLFVEAVNVCRQMLMSLLDPDSVAISSILSGLSMPSNLGLEIHGWVLRRGLEENLSVANALISMYSSSSSSSGHGLNRARAIFNAMIERDVVSWNAIICAHRRDRRVVEIFRQMEISGVSPDGVTFVSLLSAFASQGLVEDGRRLFGQMEEKYKMKPRMEHYSCMVNLLGREGLVDEAYQLVSERMPFEGGQTVWGALLYACSLHGNVSVGEVAAERLFELEPDNAYNFQLMMKIYSNAGRLEEADKVRRLMKDRGLES